MVDAYFGRFVLPEDLHAALQKCRSIAYIETQEELDELVFGPTHSSRYESTTSSATAPSRKRKSSAVKTVHR